QVAGVVLAPLLPAAERGVGPVRLRVEEEEPAAVEDQSTRLPPHPHGAQGAPGARPVSSDQGSTRRLTQRSATTTAAAVRSTKHTERVLFEAAHRMSPATMSATEQGVARMAA